MNKYHSIFIASLFFLTSGTASSDQNTSLNNDEAKCYSVAMIGYDYVINSRVGVPLTRALNTVSVNLQSTAVENIYKVELQDVVQKAYLWQGSPHEYAVKTIINCARQNPL